MPDESKYGNVKEDEEMGAYAQYMKMFLTPDFQAKYPDLTKELKSSNIQRGDMEWIEDALDLSWQMQTMGDNITPEFLTHECQKKLCLSSSLKGFWMVMQQTQIKREILSEEGKKGMLQKTFDRKKGEKE
jgi:hypothetical protein